jgi:hypothetical protein
MKSRKGGFLDAPLEGAPAPKKLPNWNTCAFYLPEVRSIYCGTTLNFRGRKGKY